MKNPNESTDSLVVKQIQLEFADTRIRAVDCITDIRNAVENATRNLFTKYGVRLQTPTVTEYDRVIVEIQIPIKIADRFAIGNHLRGVSKYLLDNFSSRYQPYLVGRRLLNYIDASKAKQKSEELSATDRFEAIISFTRLMERSDKVAMDRIKRILTILDETEY